MTSLILYGSQLEYVRAVPSIHSDSFCRWDGLEDTDQVQQHKKKTVEEKKTVTGQRYFVEKRRRKRPANAPDRYFLAKKRPKPPADPKPSSRSFAERYGMEW